MTNIKKQDLETLNKIKKIQNLQNRLTKTGCPIITNQLKENHYFGHKVYCRELNIPAGTVLTGKIHRDSTINVLLKGKISVSDGENSKTLEAPEIIVSPALTKRVGKTHTDTIWLTFHYVESENLEQIENDVIVDENDLSKLETEINERLQINNKGK